jgi:hypothetical protein
MSEHFMLNTPNMPDKLEKLDNLDMPAAIPEWIPTKLVRREQEWCCQWLNLSGKQFSEPFFSETILNCQGLPANTKAGRYASLGTLDYLTASASKVRDAVTPSAFVFHASRCGSTLISQLLGMNPDHIVLSEVPLIDELLRQSVREKGADRAGMEAALQSCITLLGRRRFGRETHLFVKLDSWHVYFADTIRRLYPNVPFVMLYRSPEEIVRSHQKRRGMQAVPGLLEPELFGMSPGQLDSDADVYLGKVLAYYFSRFLAMTTMAMVAATATQDERAILLDYKQGSMAILDRLIALCDIVMSPEEREKVEIRSRYHSKYPEQSFSEKQAEAPTPKYLEAAKLLYERLEQIRLAWGH